MNTNPKPKFNQLRNGSLDKAIRLVIILVLQELGQIKPSTTHAEILNLLPKKYRPSLVTIGRDLRAINKVKIALQEVKIDPEIIQRIAERIKEFDKGARKK